MRQWTWRAALVVRLIISAPYVRDRVCQSGPENSNASPKQESCNIDAEFLPPVLSGAFLSTVSALKHIFNELQYELTRKIAEGGMGLVYEAVQRGSGNFRKIVAIKLIREEYSSIPEFQKNFIGEARLVADDVARRVVDQPLFY